MWWFVIGYFVIGIVVAWTASIYSKKADLFSFEKWAVIIFVWPLLLLAYLMYKIITIGVEIFEALE